MKAAPRVPSLPARAVIGLLRIRTGATVAPDSLGCTVAQGQRALKAAQRLGLVDAAGRRTALDPADPACKPIGKKATAAEEDGAAVSCRGECGGWRRARATDGDGVIAVGPTTSIYDSEGRMYGARYELRDGAAVVASHTPDGRPVAGYPAQLQARERGGAASRAQVAALAAGLDADRLMAPSSDAATGAPIIHPAGWVVSGNGRRAAVEVAATRRTTWPAEYAAAVLSRWHRHAAALRPLLRRAPGAIVVRLAGASQAVDAAELSDLERAVSRARAVGVASPLELGRLVWLEPLSAETFKRFVTKNRAWWAAATDLADPARRPGLSTPDIGARWALDLMLAGLPAEVLRLGIGDGPTTTAMIGALPGLWTLEADAAEGEVWPAVRLLPALAEARRWLHKVGGKRLAEVAAMVSAEDRQVVIPGTGLDTAGVDRLAVALAVALLKASRRASPEDAAAEYVEAWRRQALEWDPRAAGLFGPAEPPPDPGGAFARLVQVKI